MSRRRAPQTRLFNPDFALPLFLNVCATAVCLAALLLTSALAVQTLHDLGDLF